MLRHAALCKITEETFHLASAAPALSGLCVSEFVVPCLALLKLLSRMLKCGHYAVASTSLARLFPLKWLVN